MSRTREVNRSRLGNKIGKEENEADSILASGNKYLNKYYCLIILIKQLVQLVLSFSKYMPSFY